MSADLLIRCSSLGKIMTEPRSKSEGLLSKGAKTHIREIAAQTIFGVDFEIHGRELDKGIRCEPEAIALLNRVRGLRLVKNTERRSDGFITGECDLHDAARRAGYDLKCSWSIKTFPLVTVDCEDTVYEWQCRGYMKLWEADEWHVAYCLLDTPDDLLGYEPQSLHFVSHIPETLRLTTWTVTRDRTLEELMAAKVRAAREYLAEVIREFDVLHRRGRPAAALDPAPWDEQRDAVIAAPAAPLKPASASPRPQLVSTLF